MARSDTLEFESRQNKQNKQNDQSKQKQQAGHPKRSNAAVHQGGKGAPAAAKPVKQLKKKAAVKQKAARRLADAKAQMYHDVIFEAAESVFGRNGYERSTMQQIAEEAGTSLKTVYVSYESKQALFADITRTRAGEFYETIREAMGGEGEPRERLTRGVEAYTLFLFAHEDWLRIHLHSRIAWAFRPADEKTAAWWEEGHEAYARLLREGMERGDFLPSDAEETALLVQTVMQVIVGRAVQRGETDATVVAAAILAQLRRLLGVDVATA
jgi:AcrR family transcriptional regulator